MRMSGLAVAGAALLAASAVRAEPPPALIYPPPVMTAAPPPPLPPTPPMPVYLGGEASRLGDMVIILSPGVHAPDGVVARGARLVSFPFRFRRTGVLKSDVRSRGLMGMHLGSAGAATWYLGTYTDHTNHSRELWCFTAHLILAPGPACVMVSRPAGTGITAVVLNPYLPARSVGTLDEQFNTTNLPEIEEGPNPEPGMLGVDYRFKGWSRDGIPLVEGYVKGKTSGLAALVRRPDGYALITPVGAFLLSPVADDAGKASFTRMPDPVAGAAQPIDLASLLASYYPDRAARLEKSGRVALACDADSQGVLSNCEVVSEDPPDFDFSEAALRIVRFMRAAPGETGRVRKTFTFKPPQ